ncbi:assembly of actin patch protein [Marasmius sp. AFHP31]|nr:assembly of actin patch protein [Marasmius sp. AFHP31]
MFVYLPSEKERVAKELASTDGMSLGRPSRSPPPTRAVSPPSRVVPPPQRQQDEGNGYTSEMEDVEYEDAREQGKQEEVPQPPPPPPPRSTYKETRCSCYDADADLTFVPATNTNSESYVMCEFEKPGNVEEEEATPPPPRPVGQLKGKTPGQRREHRYGDGTEKWEIPEFGGGKVAALSLSSYDFLGVAAGAGTGAVPKLSPSQSQQTQAQQPQQTLTSDDLMVVWGRVGVEVREVATGLYEKSKRALIGDGTYRGFVDATLSQVPNAAATPDSYGYLIYQQSGSSVQKRASEILPGDIVWLKDAKLKGHKGLHTYTQHVGEGDEACVGVVSELEAKKFKVRVFQANQHVGQQTVESVSCRMEDLKSGVVKVFRVLEA